MTVHKITILTNARAAGQHSMIGYGQLLLEAARQTGEQTCELRGISFFARAGSGGRLGKFARNIDRFLLTPAHIAGHRTDIMHVADPGNVVYLPLVRHGMSICTVHDMIPYLARLGRLEGFHPSATGSRLMDRILKQLARVDKIICVSHATRRDLLSFVEIDPARVSVIHNAVFQPMAPATEAACQALRIRYGLPAQAPLILHVGKNFYKNRSVVLDVFARVHRENRDARMVLVGALEPSLRAQAARLNIGDALHVVPCVAGIDMPVLYSIASVLLFPSLYEGFGYPVLEAQLCCTPVICSDRGSLPEVAGEGAVLVDALDVDGLADNVSRILCDHTTRINLVNRGKTNAAQFDTLNWQKSNMNIYRQYS
jgi:glycosyltransferase involved in cell wall biosynthesis